MLYYVLKIAVSALLIVAISEVAKRSSTVAALIASLPLTSILAFIWLYIENAKPEQVVALSSQIFWLVMPSLILFLMLPMLLKQGVGFWLSLALSIAATAIGYLAMLPLLRRFGINL